MSIRTAVLIILALSGVYAATFAPQIIQTFNEILGYIAGSPALIAYMFGSALLLLCGHAIRAYRDTILFSKAACTTTRSQFLAFTVGSLCNSILPLRIGEFVRADIIAQRWGISFSFSFVLICIERLVDVLILGLLALGLIGFNIPLAIAGCALFVFIALLWSSPNAMRRALSSVGTLFSEKVEAKLLFTFWSLEYGLKRTLRIGLVAKYIALSVINWAVYIASLLPVIMFLWGPEEMIRLSAGVFVALTTSVAPSALGDYTPTISSFGFEASPDLILLWIIAVVPTALVGLILALFNLRHLPLLRRRNKQDLSVSLNNKLSRNADISADQLGFMKDYYGGKPLARKIALEEMAGGSAFAKYFTAGGSGAMTYQSMINGEPCVVKLVSQSGSDALRSQFEWLKRHTSPNIVKVIGEDDDGETYSIAIEYVDSAIELFDYLHENSSGEGSRVLAEVVQALDEAVWRRDGTPLSYADDAGERVENYIKKNVLDSLDVATKYVPNVREAMECSHVIVNGVEYPNIDKMLARIHQDDVFSDLSQFRVSPSIHGDLICDNLIYSASSKRPIILDPVDNGRNYLDGPVFDFGKLSQSLQIGYEFLLRDDSPVEVCFDGEKCIVGYLDHRSAVYEALWQYVYEELAPQYLTEAELRTVLFLGATNYFRRMKYQAVQYPQNAMKIYAVGIRYLSEYLDHFGGSSDD